jgi:allophanate hydrolase subunit 2
LRTGDIVEGFEAEPLDTMHRMPQELVPKFTHHFQVQAVLGPQADMFTEKGVDTFFSSEYRVTPEADRMGYRLEGPLIEHKGKADIVSDALLPGSVQVPKNGKPIVIMRDAQTTGGYPKIAVITTPDVSLLGQAKPNDMIEFSEVTLSQAQERLREYSRLINGLNRMLVKAV